MRRLLLQSAFFVQRMPGRPPEPDPSDTPVHELVSAATVNFQTPELIDEAVRSFHRHYPNVRILVIDNGSRDSSVQVIRSLEADLRDCITPLFLDQNRYHGPAMHLAMERLKETPYVFMLDSDTVTRAGGFLEDMVARCREEDVYGAGKVVCVDRRGFAAERGTPVLSSAFMLLKRARYLKLPPFVHHGLPALKNFEAAHRAGYRLIDYPIDDYIDHLGRGTADRFGYGLGLRARLEYLLHRLGF